MPINSNLLKPNMGHNTIAPRVGPQRGCTIKFQNVFRKAVELKTCNMDKILVCCMFLSRPVADVWVFV